MKQAFGTLAALIIALAAVGCGNVGDAPEAKTGEAVEVSPGTGTPGTTTPSTGGASYTIDTSRSKVSWVGAKVTGKHDGGFRTYDGIITVDGGNVIGVKIHIDANSIWSDDEKLTGHLKSPDFFAVEQHPRITFEASQVTKVDTVAGATHMVTGNLMMRGVTKGVTFPASITVDPQTVKALADFKINRKDWEIVYAGAPDNLISDDVRIVFDITAVNSNTVAEAR